MLKKSLHNYKKTAFILGALSVFAFAPYFVLPILFISFGWLFYYVAKIPKARKLFSCAYWFGFGLFGLGFLWVGNALLIDVSKTGFLYPLVFLASGAFFGLFLGLPIMACAYFKNVYHKYFAFVNGIVLFEWARSWFLTGFPWNPIGSSLGFSPYLMQLASVGGVFFLSLVALYILTLPALFFVTKKKRIIVCFVALLSLVIGFGVSKVNAYKYEASKTKVRMVQPAIPQTLKWDEATLEDNFKKYINMSKKNNKDVNLVIWGETASPYALEFNKLRRKQITEAVPKGGYLITGLLRYEIDGYGKYHPLNAMAVVDENSEIINHYNKSHLVPFGEYIPMREYLPKFIKPVVNIIGSFKAGDGPRTILLENIPSFGSSICYEIIFPNANVDRHNKPEFLINLTNDGWYGRSSGPYQHLLSAQFRAVEEGLSVVRVANTGISAFISPIGEVLEKIELEKSDIKDFYLPKQTSVETIYQHVENYLLLVLIIITFGFIIFRRRKYEQ